MKKIFYFLVAFTLLVVSCEKEPSEQDMNLPTVSVSVNQNFNADQTATLVIDLSTTSDKEVVVNLIETDVESGKTKLPVNFENTIIIPAGTTEVTIDIVANIENLQTGSYQSAIKIESAENAIVNEDDVVYINYQGEIGPLFTSLELVEVLASDDFEEIEPWINFDQKNVDTKLNNALGGTQQYHWTNTWGGACVHEGKSAVDGTNCLQIHWGGTVRLQDFTIDPDQIYQLEVMVHPIGGISGEWNNWGAVHLFVFDQSNVWQNQGVRIRISNNDANGNSPALLGLDVWEGEEGAERAVNLFEFSDKWQEYTIDDAEDGTPNFWVPLKLIFKGKGTTDNPFMIDFYLNDEYVASQSFDDIYWLGDSMIGLQNSSDNEDLCRYDNFKLSVMRDSNSSEN